MGATDERGFEGIDDGRGRGKRGSEVLGQLGWGGVG